MSVGVAAKLKLTFPVDLNDPAPFEFAPKSLLE
jgi:hypothetical protein